jgi:CBS-domain-containing membrane protein
MASNVITLQSIDKVENILAALKSGHHGFPILNSKGNVTGLIPRNYMIIILRNF